MTTKTVTHVPLQFDSLTIAQMQQIETRAILTHDNMMRFDALKAAQGDRDAARRVMTRVKADPTWIRITRPSA